MNFVDLFNLMLHRTVAEKLQENPESVLQIACNNLERWLASESFAGSERLALLEWQNILETYAPEEICKIIVQNTDEGQRLRSSSPFAGVLSEAEREKIWSECAEIQSV
jgi:hypothetical protein